MCKTCTYMYVYGCAVCVWVCCVCVCVHVYWNIRPSAVTVRLKKCPRPSITHPNTKYKKVICGQKYVHHSQSSQSHWASPSCPRINKHLQHFKQITASSQPSGWQVRWPPWMLLPAAKLQLCKSAHWVLWIPLHCALWAEQHWYNIPNAAMLASKKYANSPKSRAHVDLRD